MSEIEKVIKEVVKLNCGDYDCILPENEIDNTDFYGGKSGSCSKCKYNIILQALQEKLEREEGFEFESSRRDSEERCKHRCCNICDRLRQEKAERENGCEYCSGNVDDRKDLLALDGGCVYISGNGNLVHQDDSGFTIDRKIGYCPMCGRKLVEE